MYFDLFSTFLRSLQTTRFLAKWQGCASQRTNGWNMTQSEFNLQHILGFVFWPLSLSQSLQNDKYSWTHKSSACFQFVSGRVSHPLFIQSSNTLPKYDQKLCNVRKTLQKKQAMHELNACLCQGFLEVPIIAVMVKIYLKGPTLAKSRWCCA